MKGIIYKYTAPNGKMYIGQTTNEALRRTTFNKPNASYGGIKIDNARKLYGPDNFIYEIIEERYFDDYNDAKKVLNELEMKYIEMYDTFHNGYNMTRGGVNIGDSMKFDECRQNMIKHLKEYYKKNDVYNKGKTNVELFGEEKARIISEKISKSRVGKPSSFKGRHWSEEQRKAISERVKKQVAGKNNPFYGKKHTQRTKDIISEHNSVPVVQIDPKTNEILHIFQSAYQAGVSFGSEHGNSEIIKVCRGYVSPDGRRYFTSLGFKWKYARDIEGSTTIGTDGKRYYNPSTSTSQANGDGSGEHPSVGEDIV